MKYEFLEKLEPNTSHTKLISQIRPGSTVLECGCAGGYMTKYLKEQLNCRVYIVELDREGFESALRFAEDGVCGDLMTAPWAERFAKVAFDHLLFADVLEHLPDPARVLRKALGLLKPEGSVLVSLPNVGHNDVVAKLISGRWDYTSLGLLDDTHIHFWGIGNFERFFGDLGLGIVCKDYTFLPTGMTEQCCRPRQLRRLPRSVRRRPEGEVYQFVLTLKRAELVTETEDRIRSARPPKPFGPYVFAKRAARALLRRSGLPRLGKKLRFWLRGNLLKRLTGQVDFSAAPLDPSRRRERKAQRAQPGKCTFSLLLPLTRRDEKATRRLIRSLLDQTHGDWELCMAGPEALCPPLTDPRLRFVAAASEDPAALRALGAQLATGSYLCLLEEGALLHPSALWELDRVAREGDRLIYTDHSSYRKTPADSRKHFLKPDYGPDTLRGSDYMGPFLTFPAALLPRLGGLEQSSHELCLRLSELVEVCHLPRVLYYRPDTPLPGGDCEAVSRHLQRLGCEARVKPAGQGCLRLRWALQEQPLVSILIPNYEHLEDLQTCLTSIFEKTTYSNYEILIIENNSHSPALFDYYRQLQQTHKNVRLVVWEGPFNFAAINNFAAAQARGQHLLLLNNDTRVISPDWLQELLMYSQRPDVGAVGAMLYYADDTVQHAGAVYGIYGIAAHIHRGRHREDPGYMGRLRYAQQLSVVTGACLMLRREVWDAMEGLDENFAVAFNDVDLCMRIRRAGLYVIFTPHARLYHYESKSRGYEDTPEKVYRFQGEINRFRSRWGEVLDRGDPYYNPHFSTESENFDIRY